MDSPRIKNEGWLYGLAFLIALALRFIQLGAAPLTDSEARLALQALHLAQGQSQLLAPQPIYILFTSLFFLVIESTNFMARIVPALVGSAMIFTPYFFREKIKPHPALILAFFFAIDPGLVALSRISGGTILAVTFLLFAWGLWINKKQTLAGIFLGSDREGDTKAVRGRFDLFGPPLLKQLVRQVSNIRHHLTYHSVF